MKTRLQLAASLAALLMISNTFPVCAANAAGLCEAAAYSQSNAFISGSVSSEEWETVSSGDAFPFSGDTLIQELSAAGTERVDLTVPDETPVFSAHVEYSPQGYVARGTFTEFLPCTSLVQPLYSLDGEVWQTCRTTWNMQWLNRDTADDLRYLQTQTCLYGTDEPLAGYLAGQLDRFYLKLQITLENGLTYETQAAVIDRGDPQPIPEEFNAVASFVPSMLIHQWSPFIYYGQYQITVSASATPEDIFALLPDTLPIEIQLYTGIDFVTNAVADCPVTWKPLSLSQLTAGESVTITDAAEEIIVPAGTLLNTPNGIFQLNEPLSFEHDDLRLILNVVAGNAEPTGVLSGYFEGLELSFNLKPTGATAIRAYIFSGDESEWAEIPDPLLPEKVNAPSSTANSAYTFLLKSTMEPYQSYLTAWNAGEEPAPFWVGLKIEGGVYDGKQLILAWPDTYELPARLPVLSGCGGNECNAGADNKNDSTSEGQRPDLPQNPEDKPDSQNRESPQNPKDEQDTQEPELQQKPKDEPDTQKPELRQSPEYKPGVQQPAPHIPEAKPERQPDLSQTFGEQQSQLQQILKKERKDRQPEQFRPLGDDEADRHTAGKVDTFLHVSIAETSLALISGEGNLVSVPADNAENRSPAAAAISIGICIAMAAAVKVTAGSMSGKISGKIIRMIYRLLHLK